MTSAKTRSNAKRAHIDKNLPHQVALADDLCCMENYTLIENFCRRFDRQPQTLQVKAKWPNGKQELFRLYCFARREDAEVFAAHFEGVHFNARKDRENGRVTGAWLRTDEWKPIVRSGPLEMPRFFRDHG